MFYNRDTIKFGTDGSMTLFDGFLIAYIVLSVIAVILYMPRMIGFLCAFKKPPYKRATVRRKIGIVIPARNESDVIGDLFASIGRQDYDGPFDVNVIVKDPHDPTIRLAEKMGARVLVVPEQTCKGDVLDAFFHALSPEEMQSYDAFVIVDADGVLSPTYVRELNNALEWEEYDIFLTRKYMKNCLGDRKKRTVFSNNSALTWAMLDDLGNRWRIEQGIPLALTGQGMMVRRTLIEEIGGWPYRSLTEDYELRLDSLIKGFRSFYYPYAVLYTEEAVGHRDNYNRRLRWLTGYAQCDDKYKKRILEQAKQRGKINKAELECLFGIYPLAMFAATTIVTMLAGGGLAAFYATQGLTAMWVKSLIFLVGMPFGIMYLLLFAYSTLAMIASREAFEVITVGERIAMLFFSPFYLLEYLPIFIQSRVRAKKHCRLAWEQSERQHYESAADEAEKASETLEKPDGENDEKKSA